MSKGQCDINIPNDVPLNIGQAFGDVIVAMTLHSSSIRASTVCGVSAQTMLYCN